VTEDEVIPDDACHTSRVDAEARSTRVDRWLTAARLFKSRSQAQQACEAGHVTVNGATVKPSRAVQVGDKVSARAPRGLVVVVVLDIEEKRQGNVRAKELYEDHSPPVADGPAHLGVRARGAGRPTKAERRAIARLTGVDSDT
jgi:ribosome-associated heat shock protein Hsp15